MNGIVWTTIPLVNMWRATARLGWNEMDGNWWGSYGARGGG